MRHNALGLVEVRGYLAGIAAADAALKAANVTCLGIERVKDGFRMIKLSGDVGAVQAAVDAGAEVATQLDALVTRHVIARMHEETAAMVLGPNDTTENQQKPVSSGQVETAIEMESEVTAAAAAEDKATTTDAIDTTVTAQAVETNTTTTTTTELTALPSKQETTSGKTNMNSSAVSVKPTAKSAVKRSKNKKKASS